MQVVRVALYALNIFPGGQSLVLNAFCDPGLAAMHVVKIALYTSTILPSGRPVIPSGFCGVEITLRGSSVDHSS